LGAVAHVKPVPVFLSPPGLARIVNRAEEPHDSRRTLLERRSEAALRPGRYSADTIASLPLEQGSPHTNLFVCDARETSERGESTDRWQREALQLPDAA